MSRLDLSKPIQMNITDAKEEDIEKIKNTVSQKAKIDDGDVTNQADKQLIAWFWTSSFFLS